MKIGRGITSVAAVLILGSSAMAQNYAIHRDYAPASTAADSVPPDNDDGFQPVRLPEVFNPWGLHLEFEDQIVRMDPTPRACEVRYAAGVVTSLYRSPADFMGKVDISGHVVLCDGNGLPIVGPQGEILNFYAEVHVNGLATGRSIEGEGKTSSSPEYGQFLPFRPSDVHQVTFVLVRLPEQNATPEAEVLDPCLRGGSPIAFTALAKPWFGDIDEFGICALGDPSIGG